jgi:outer membrane protein TolC
MYAEQELQFRVTGRWVEVLAARELITIGEAALTASIESLTEIERRFRGGDATVQDVQQARARAIQTEAQLMDAKAQLDIAELNLRETVGPEAAIPLSFSVRGLSALRFVRMSTDVLFGQIEERNYEIISSRFQEEAARLEREKASSDRRPTLDAFVSVMKGNSETLTSIKDENRIGLQLSVPLYTHGAIGAAVAQADANYRKAQAQTRAVMMRLRSEALSANGTLDSLAIRVAAADRAAEAAGITLRAQQQGVKAGVTSRAEVAQATQELLAVRRQQVQVRREFAASWLKLQQILSGFDESTLDHIEARLAMR